MFSASFFSLIKPALEAEVLYMPTWLIVVISVVLGAGFLWLIDKIVREELGVAKTVEKVLNEVIANADEALKGFDPKAMLVELNNLQNGTLIK